MFGKVMDLNVKHDVVGAFMFFLVHLVILAGVSTIGVHILSVLGFVDGSVGSFLEGGSIHTLIGSLFVLWLGGSILHVRGLTNDIMSVIIVVAGLYLAFTSSVILGLVPIALLTTIGKK